MVIIRVFIMREISILEGSVRMLRCVCNRLLNHPVADRDTRIIQPKRDVKPFDMADYDIHQFNPQDRATQKKFYPFFKHRGIDLYTQYAFHLSLIHI